MVSAFNHLNVKVSCLGNHDLDFGVPRMTELIDNTSPTTWLVSNLYIKETGLPVGDLERWKVEEVQATGGTLRIGFFGLAEKEWLPNLSPLVTQRLKCADPVKTGIEMSRFLREEQKCDFIIALTHMRLPSDRLLAASVPGIDLVLGGHDHFYINEVND